MSDSVSIASVLLWAVQGAWAVGVVLAGMVWRDVLRRIRSVETRVDRAEDLERSGAQRVAVLETQYDYIAKQLDSINRKLDRMCRED